MPILVNAVPKYRKHHASGQAIVTLAGKDHHLGPHGTKATHLESRRTNSFNGKPKETAEMLSLVSAS